MAGAHPLTAPGPFSIWDLVALAALLVSGVSYAVGTIRRMQRHAGQPWYECAAFAGGWLALVAAVLPPIDALAIELFSIHMVQHELMMLVGAPLVIAGRPLATCLWALPTHMRHVAAAPLQSGAALSAWRAMTAPAIAWAIHGVTIWVWHLPSLYDLAVANEGVHALEHALFISTAALFWWGVLYGRYGRAGYGAAVFFVFVTVVHTGILGAMITLASGPIYPVYVQTSAARGVDVVADQQVAGLLMWVPAGIVMTCTGIALFAAWLGEAERRSRVGSVAHK